MWTLKDILRCRPDALVTAGIPCSSFIFLSAGSSKRTSSNPMGDQSQAFVAQANHIVGRVTLLLLVALVRALQFSVEQPNSTCLFGLPLMKYVRELAEILGLTFHEKFLSEPHSI